MSGSEVFVKVDLGALRTLIRDGSVTLRGSRHREPARSITVWLGLADDLARDDDPPFPPADAELGEPLKVPGLVLPWRRTSVAEINEREGW